MSASDVFESLAKEFEDIVVHHCDTAAMSAATGDSILLRGEAA